ncbi:PMT family glycosyltransferase, 4-amino-4-deoxy-L-arabinose transferase [Rivularia sp. PCC 7116]|uniref:phospholipid carrier-dependent glycosyltransferase n=1 Tax=Rivularia sp. PCC 7116 TaxID=373994 RepID=UPI00029F4B4B|nr:phospholipid carrier-dependent glycosyltransferase [Rivularia sp. PCC 7116]AFY56380.1 PMT family glycosyltransferase, 4-amino-4-deoxy-L-arabinose transferase [Rivularia sp. PCC 7116]
MKLLILTTIWLLGVICDRVWFFFDKSIPSWDQADYLTGSLNYLQALQNPDFLNGEWWQNLWLLSSKIPPFTYIITAFIQSVYGKGYDEATLIMLGFSAVLIFSVYGLGKILFGDTVGLWAAALCQVMPGLYRYRLEFLLDYPLAAIVTLSFFCLTLWFFAGYKNTTFRKQKNNRTNTSPPPLLYAIFFGLSFGLALMVKQTALFFLITPIIWVVVTSILKGLWGRLLQLIAAFGLSTFIFGWWYRTNWLLILTSGKRATVDSAIAEGEAPLNTIQAWIFYWHQLPSQVSLPLLLVPILALLLYWGKAKKQRRREGLELSTALQWLAIFLIGAYILSCLNPNKDFRYVLPYLPVLSVFLAYGLTRFQGTLGKRIRWGTFGLAILLMLFNLFPIGGIPGYWLTQALSNKVQHYPYVGEKFPHTQVIKQIIQTEPYLYSNVGVLPSTPQINQHNLNYYGALQNFQVYGRQVGTKKSFVKQDAGSISWFLTKSKKQGSVPKSQNKITKIVEQNGDFELNKSWNLPDDSILKLYHQKNPPVVVEKRGGREGRSNNNIVLEKVEVPQIAPPGKPVPVTYIWEGNWEQLQNGLMLLTWKNADNSKWIHDHAIALGKLYPYGIKPVGRFQVTERIAMLPPAEIKNGNYTLEATYLNKLTGQTYPLNSPQTILQIDSQATSIPAPELDLSTQLRSLAATLPQGIKALNKVFYEIGRINQYDPNQDYLVQTRKALEYRLQQEQNLKYAYSVALTDILQRKPQAAIASLQRVTQLDKNNPYAWAYLAFVQLYDFQGAAAEKSLQPALEELSDVKEIKALSAVAALQQGKLIQVWQLVNELMNGE